LCFPSRLLSLVLSMPSQRHCPLFLLFSFPPYPTYLVQPQRSAAQRIEAYDYQSQSSAVQRPTTPVLGLSAVPAGTLRPRLYIAIRHGHWPTFPLVEPGPGLVTHGLMFLGPILTVSFSLAESRERERKRKRKSRGKKVLRRCFAGVRYGVLVG
jgi:hypothetical protein